MKEKTTSGPIDKMHPFEEVGSHIDKSIGNIQSRSWRGQFDKSWKIDPSRLGLKMATLVRS